MDHFSSNASGIKSSEFIETMPVDELMISATWPDRVVQVKIDVEGHEASALAGMLKTLQRDQPFLYVEFENRKNDAEYYKAMYDVLKLGYQEGGYGKQLTAQHPKRTSLQSNSTFEAMMSWFEDHVIHSTCPIDILLVPPWVHDNREKLAIIK
mmetsp:Transcript_35966/g.64333  ORF Transcript_35966/g.64333 Transcript_35966/m.64333 type:complete len:153 (-) Transcript_35966:142-600(-)